MKSKVRYVWVGTKEERKVKAERVVRVLTAKWEKQAEENRHKEILEREFGIRKSG